MQQPGECHDFVEDRSITVLKLITCIACFQALPAAPLDEVQGAQLVLASVHSARYPAGEGRLVDDRPHFVDQPILLLRCVGLEQIDDGQVPILGGNEWHDLLTSFGNQGLRGRGWSSAEAKTVSSPPAGLAE